METLDQYLRRKLDDGCDPIELDERVTYARMRLFSPVFPPEERGATPEEKFKIHALSECYDSLGESNRDLFLTMALKDADAYAEFVQNVLLPEIIKAA